jgi:gluconolactonase
MPSEPLVRSLAGTCTTRTASSIRQRCDCGRGTGNPDDDPGFASTLWCGWGMGTAELDGVFIYSPEGKLIGRIHLPERCANLCFGGAKRNRLFMAASKSLYSLYVNTQGAAGG